MIGLEIPVRTLSRAVDASRGQARKLLRDVSGIAVIELAICLPPLLFMGMYGLELMNLAAVNLEVSQIALSLADNASRLGQTDNSGVAPTINESDIDSVMTGALTQGDSLDISTNGKIILSSLEKDNAGKQYIHWQRCRGSLDKDSAYGDDGNNNGLGAKTISGMGSGTQKATAVSTDSAVMFVEVYYTYQNIFGDMFISDGRVIKREAAYLVRDDRDLLHSSTGDPTTVTDTKDGLSGTRNAADTCA